MLRDKNRGTQPYISKQIFNNWNVLNRGWYFVCPSPDLSPGQIRGLDLCGQHIVVYRGIDKRLRALDGFCPHMGTDLAIGKVDGKHIRCFFHHWEFDEKGQCQNIPCKKDSYHKSVNIQSYSVFEKFGVVWVYPERQAPKMEAFEEYPEDAKFEYQIGNVYERNCHYHITMVNGLDAQHLRTVHDINIKMNILLSQDKTNFKAELWGEVPDHTFKERLIRKILGPKYGYSIKYESATIGFLTLMKNVKLFNRWKIPELTMLFAYRPNGKRAEVLPVFVTKKRPGVVGWLKNSILLWMTKRAFNSLRDEDGKIYDNMRFSPHRPLDIDQPVMKFIDYVESQKASMWSIQEEETKTQSIDKQLKFDIGHPNPKSNELEPRAWDSPTI